MDKGLLFRTPDGSELSATEEDSVEFATVAGARDEGFTSREEMEEETLGGG